MAWTAPKTWNTGDPATSGDLNTYIRDNSEYLYGDTAWTDVTAWLNGWGNYTGYATRFAKVGHLVVVDGAVSGGTLGAAAFKLPAGYIPGQYQLIGTVSNSAFGRFDIDTSGDVIPQVGSNAWMSVRAVFSVL